MQEIVLFLKACVKKVELSGKMLNKVCCVAIHETDICSWNLKQKRKLPKQMLKNTLKKVSKAFRNHILDVYVTNFNSLKRFV